MRRRRANATPLIVVLLLAACNSTDSVLDPSSGPKPSVAIGDPPAMALEETVAGAMAEPASILAAENRVPPVIPSPEPRAAGTLGAQAAALSSGARVRFAPIVGPTVEAATPLMRRLSQRAAQRGIALTSGGAAAATHLMKGYFSVIADRGETTVIYVWDVLDPSGNRLHRIQGQEKTKKSAAQGWRGVPGPTMEVIADSTIERLAAWLAARSG